MLIEKRWAIDREALSVNREVRSLIDRSELFEKSKNGVVSAVVLRELLALLREIELLALSNCESGRSKVRL